MMRLVQTRHLRRGMKRAEAFAVEQLERGKQTIAEVEREHLGGNALHAGRSEPR